MNYNERIKSERENKRALQTIALALMVAAILAVATETVKAQIRTDEGVVEIDEEPSSTYEVIETVTLNATVTAYNAVPEQTDDTPEITASGKRVAPGYIACPISMKFGTKVIIENEIYECQDRMHPKYQIGNYFDIYMEGLQDAKEFGRQQLQVQVIK